MIRKLPGIALLAILLLVLMLAYAGCLSVPGPGDAKKTPAITTTTTSSGVEMTPAVQTPVVRRTTSPARTLVTTIVPAETPSGASAGLSDTCSQRGGTEVQAGYRCTGTWLSASDTFSCCSTVPVRETTGGSNESVTTIPSSFSLSVNLDDDPGSITP